MDVGAIGAHGGKDGHYKGGKSKTRTAARAKTSRNKCKGKEKSTAGSMATRRLSAESERPRIGAVERSATSQATTRPTATSTGAVFYNVVDPEDPIAEFSDECSKDWVAMVEESRRMRWRFQIFAQIPTPRPRGDS